jgi:N-dimethylarginine dimethylaminohydrolase
MGEREFGGQSMFNALRTVLMRRPDGAFRVDNPADWNYSSQPDLDRAQREHDGLVSLLVRAGIEVLYHSEVLPDHADSIFVFDPVLMTNRGAVTLRMGKPQRRGEEEPLAECLRGHHIPILDSVLAPGTVEGGDLLWLDEHTLAAGIGFRTNSEGIRQLAKIMSRLGVQILRFDLPYFHGPDACLHLLSLISLVDRDLAVVYRPLLPVRLWQELQQRGIGVVEVPDSEFPTLGPNVLALSPRKCLMLEGNSQTARKLEEQGCEVWEYAGTDVSLKVEGGPTCLTQPLLRSRDQE